MLTKDELNQIEKRCNAATKGPWRPDWEGTNHFEIQSPEAEHYWVCHPDGGFAKGEDLEFAAHARKDIPDLLEYIKFLQKNNE